MYPPHTLPLWTLLLTASSAFPNSPQKRQTTPPPSTIPLPPTQDPFYTAPQDFTSAAPGTILRFRSAPGNLTSATGNSSAAYNILYRTTDSHYAPSWAVTTLFIPSSPSTDPATLLSYQIPYNSADLDASPSYALYAPNPPLDIANALGLGWYVSVPDFEGPLAAFGAGVTDGHATLDAVRAVLTGFGLPSSTQYALWGYSGGALASEWAAELAVQYAPELNFSGAALGGLPSNITTVLQAANGMVFAGLVPEILLGISRAYPEIYAYLVSQLKPESATAFLSAANMSIAEAFAAFSGQNVYSYFVDGAAVLYAPVIQQAINRDVQMGYHGVPQMPIFMYKAIQDELIPIAETDTLVAKYCGVGANILYERNTIGGHLAEYTNGAPRAFEWLQDIFAGCEDEWL